MATDIRFEVQETDDAELQTFEVVVSSTGHVLLSVARCALDASRDTDGEMVFALEPDTAAALGRSLVAIADVATPALARARALENAR